MRARERSNGQVNPANYIAPEFFSNGKRSLAGIGLRAFFLGNAAIVGFFLAAQLVYHDSHLWRPFLFLGVLSVFHFLEFYTTAAYNAPSAYVSSFLLTNGNQYRIAHTMAFFETFVTSYFFPKWQSRVHSPWIIFVGITMVLVGQVVRSIAMAQAGTNFNHTVQSSRNEGHELVTHGLYAYFRHPSYFGFFWWGIGTQVMLGNIVSTIGYAGVLWYFFKTRINRKCALAATQSCHADMEQMRKGILFSSSAKTMRLTERIHLFGYRLYKAWLNNWQAKCQSFGDHLSSLDGLYQAVLSL